MTIRSLLFNPIAAVLVLLLALAIIWSLRQTSLSVQQTNRAINEAEAEVQSLEKSRDEKARKAQTAADPFTQEKIIRDELLMKKSDEAVLQLPAINKSGPDSLMPSPTTRPLQLWWNKIWLQN